MKRYYVLYTYGWEWILYNNRRGGFTKKEAMKIMNQLKQERITCKLIKESYMDVFARTKLHGGTTMKKLLFLTILSVLLVSLVGCSGNTTTYIQDAGILTDMKITDTSKKKKKKGSKEYKYYITAEKAGSIYKIEVEDEVIYDEVEDIISKTPSRKFDILYSQGAYAEKEVLGISFSSKRR